MNTFLTFALNLLSSELVKNLIKLSITKVVESTDNSIDNQLAKFMFDNIIVSNGNSITKIDTKHD